jgi:hypothetical protein
VDRGYDADPEVRAMTACDTRREIAAMALWRRPTNVGSARLRQMAKYFAWLVSSYLGESRSAIVDPTRPLGRRPRAFSTYRQLPAN